MEIGESGTSGRLANLEAKTGKNHPNQLFRCVPEPVADFATTPHQLEMGNIAHWMEAGVKRLKNVKQIDALLQQVK